MQLIYINLDILIFQLGRMMELHFRYIQGQKDQQLSGQLAPEFVYSHCEDPFQNLPCCSVCPLPFVISLFTSGKSLVPLFLYPHTGKMKMPIRSSHSFLIFKLNKSNSSSLFICLHPSIVLPPPNFLDVC